METAPKLARIDAILPIAPSIFDRTVSAEVMEVISTAEACIPRRWPPGAEPAVPPCPNSDTVIFAATVVMAVPLASISV